MIIPQIEKSLRCMQWHTTAWIIGQLTRNKLASEAVIVVDSLTYAVKSHIAQIS